MAAELLIQGSAGILKEGTDNSLVSVVNLLGFGLGRVLQRGECLAGSALEGAGCIFCCLKARLSRCVSNGTELIDSACVGQESSAGGGDGRNREVLSLPAPLV